MSETLELVASLLQAMAWRDVDRIRAIVESRAGGKLPREVREEALAHATLPPGSLRAPMQTLLYERRLVELRDEDEARFRRAG